jgi:hypothetical protein
LCSRSGIEPLICDGRYWPAAALWRGRFARRDPYPSREQRGLIKRIIRNPRRELLRARARDGGTAQISIAKMNVAIHQNSHCRPQLSNVNFTQNGARYRLLKALIVTAYCPLKHLIFSDITRRKTTLCQFW